MVIVGIDLAAKEKNPTGICILKNPRQYMLETVYDDDKIFFYINEFKPEIVAIDAPLMESIRIRKADILLKKYGALPPTMAGMKELTKRAMRIVGKIKYPVIEVFPTASAKILGVYSRDYKEMMKKLDIIAKNKHEVDAYLSAYTAYLYLLGMADEIGDKEKVIIPKKI